MSNQNTFIFLKADQYDDPSDDLYTEVVRYCQAIDKPFLKTKNDIQNGIIQYTFQDIMCPFPVKARRQSNTAILESDTRFTKSGTHVWTYIWKTEKPQSILYFP